jgi:O-antigen biosynthesis protein
VPTISFVAASGAPEPARWATTIASLQAQSRPDWQLVVTGPRIAASPDDPRVVPVTDIPSGEVAAANALLAHGSGDYVAFVDAGDELAPNTVAAVAGAAGTGIDCVYSDEDEIDIAGRRSNPFLKPGWSPDRLRCQPYTGRVCALRRAAVDAAGGLRAAAAGAHEHDLVLRVTERGGRVAHVPDVLYHRRLPPGGVAGRHTDATAGRRVIAEHLERVAFPATVEVDPDEPGAYRLRPRLAEEPLVSIVIPTAGRSRHVNGAALTLVVNCVESIVKRSTYRNYEIVCVAGDDADATTRQHLHDLGGGRLQFVPYHGSFNFARAINLGVMHARGDRLLLLNDDTQVISADWIESMLMLAAAADVGAVGAKLLFADHRIQHAGIIAVGRGGPGHACYGFPGGDAGYADNFLVPADYLAVTGACMLTKRGCFEAVGGFATGFPLNYNDIDYCLKLRHRGLRVVFDPWAQLFHFEWSSRVSGAVASSELERLNQRWGSVLERDPFYNPGFLPSTDFRPPVRTAAAARRADASPSLRAPATALP